MREVSLAIKRLSLMVLIFLVASCAGPKKETERYHQISDVNQSGTGAVSELQNEAIRALDRGNTQQAVDYLQRAIKIEPRNPFSWYYLAQVYRYSKNFNRCIDMLERSISYSFGNDDLDSANLALRDQCSDE